MTYDLRNPEDIPPRAPTVTTAHTNYEDDACDTYWKYRALAAESRVEKLEGLLETPENQRDADSLIEYAEDCYIWYTSYQNAADLLYNNEGYEL